MGQRVEFPSNGSTGEGYLAIPDSGSGPGVVVIQEWWGLVPHIIDVADRLAGAGFVALAPDLYHGVTTTEPDEAGKLMMALNVGRAAKDMAGAVDFLLAHDAVTSDSVGVTGFCMGGGLALVLACERPDAVSVCVPFYGLIPWESVKPDYSKLEAVVRGHFAENDGFFGPDKAHALEAELKALGKDAEIEVHPGVDHAFFNDTRPEVHDATESARAWDAMVSAFRSALA